MPQRMRFKTDRNQNNFLNPFNTTGSYYIIIRLVQVQSIFTAEKMQCNRRVAPRRSASLAGISQTRKIKIAKEKKTQRRCKNQLLSGASAPSSDLHCAYRSRFSSSTCMTTMLLFFVVFCVRSFYI